MSEPPGARPVDLLTAGAVAFAGTLLLTPIALRVARRLAFLDRPGGYKAHRRPTPLLGGVSLAGGLLCGILWSTHVAGLIEFADLFALGIGLAIILVAGLVDDLRGLSPGSKLAWQFLAAGCAGLLLTFLGVRIRLFLGWDPVALTLLTVLWIIGITNAVNVLDNMNGLCAGLGAIAAGCLAIYNLRTGEILVATTAAALSGACLGFLPYNWPHARIFLGDTGSMLIGFALASLSVMGVYTPGAKIPLLAVLAPMFVLAIPILDALVVVGLRLKAGHPPWMGDRRHISHRLVQRGMRPASAVAALWAASLGCGLAALLLPTVGLAEAPLLIALVACMLIALIAAAGLRGLP